MTNATPQKTKALLKILIGAAWIDGEVQPEEREYLRTMAKAQQLEEDPEVRPLLFELVQVQPDQCYRWIEEYLGDRPSQDDYQSLLEAISALVYSDGSIEVEEAKLLNHLQELNEHSAHSGSPSQMILKSIQKLYRNWVGDNQ